uniref:Uncharacterized protein n=1 Tax=Panagrolaimus sp. ES5 TaxID=591445 RepID=A0AC34GDI5_9BILA
MRLNSVIQEINFIADKFFPSRKKFEEVYGNLAQNVKEDSDKNTRISRNANIRETNYIGASMNDKSLNKTAANPSLTDIVPQTRHSADKINPEMISFHNSFHTSLNINSSNDENNVLQVPENAENANNEELPLPQQQQQRSTVVLKATAPNYRIYDFIDNQNGDENEQDEKNVARAYSNTMQALYKRRYRMNKEANKNNSGDAQIY